jgi:hypothetical protein
MQERCRRDAGEMQERCRRDAGDAADLSVQQRLSASLLQRNFVQREANCSIMILLVATLRISLRLCSAAGLCLQPEEMQRFSESLDKLQGTLSKK